jgi:hypothetical protein
MRERWLYIPFPPKVGRWGKCYGIIKYNSQRPNKAITVATSPLQRDKPCIDCSSTRTSQVVRLLIAFNMGVGNALNSNIQNKQSLVHNVVC